MLLFIRIIVVLFAWCLVQFIINIFEDQFFCNNIFLRTYKVEGDVTGFDTITIFNHTYDISILTYTIFDMHYKTYVRSSNRG